MFFVRKESIATTLGAQKEFRASERRGIKFVSGRRPSGEIVWHYLLPESDLESGIKSSIQIDPAQPDAPEFYIWSQEVKVGELVGEPMITPYFGSTDDWEHTAAAKFG